MPDKTVFIAPAPGLLVRDPETARPLPAEGAGKPRSSFWLRRLADGDVTETAPSAPPKPAPKTDKPKDR